MAGETRYITYSGGPTGDYVCDGSADEVQINQALAWAAANPGNTIYLRGPTSGRHVYSITSAVKIGSSTIFKGDSTACIQVAASAPQFPDGTGFIDQLTTALHGVEICGFEIDGNLMNRPTSYANYDGGAHNAERAIDFRGGTTNYLEDIYLHDLHIHSCYSDAIHIAFAKNVRCKKIQAENCQHSSIFLISVVGSGNEVSYCIVRACTSDGIRFDNCVNVICHHNDVGPYTGSDTNGGWAGGINGIQVADEGYSHNGGSPKPYLTNNIQVYDNEIHDCGLSGIWVNDAQNTAAATAQVVLIFNNKFTNCGCYGHDTWSGGITYRWGNGLTIRKNTFDGCHVASVLFYGVISSSSTFTADIRENNIINTEGQGSSTPALGVSNCGYGIFKASSIASKLTLSIDGNYFSGNLKGNIYPTNQTHTNDAAAYITTSLPDGNTTSDDTPDTTNGDTGGSGGSGGSGSIDDGDTTESIYIPPSLSILDDEYEYIERDEGDIRGFINNIPFYMYSFKAKGGKVVGESKSPSVPGSNLTDFDFDGTNVTIGCHAYSLTGLDKALAAFYRRGKTTIELGGPNKGNIITGVGKIHTSGWDIRQGEFPEEGTDYELEFKCEKPYMERLQKRVRSRYVYNGMQFSNDDCFTGNKVDNSSYESWTPNTTLNWMTETSAGDYAYNDIAYSPELGLFCAISSDGYVATSPGNGIWTIQTIASHAWSSIDWSSELGIFCIVSTDGYYANSSTGDSWTIGSCPVMGWSCLRWVSDLSLWIALANSGTGNRCMYSSAGTSWAQVATADDTASWSGFDWSSELGIAAAVSYDGKAMSSPSGVSWTIRSIEAQKWIGAVFADSAFFAVSEDGTQQAATSTTGTSWALMDTPYASTIVTDGGTLVNTTAVQSTTGVSYTTPGTSYTDGYNPMFPAEADTSFTLPALTGGHIYRIDEVHCNLRSVEASYTASIEATYQIGSNAEVKFAEWTETSTSYQPKSASVAIECPTGQTLRIRFRLKTSASTHRAGATLMGYTVTEWTASGSTITYVRNQWTNLIYAPEIKLIAAVGKSGTGTRVMYCPNQVNWVIGTSAADNTWAALAYSGDLNMFAAVASSGTGNRVMSSSGYSEIKNVAPTNWTLETVGQSRSSEVATDGQFSYQIDANGLENPGQIYQPISFDTMYDTGIMYILSMKGAVSGLTQGSYRVDLYAGGTVIKELIWDADCEFIEKHIKFKFDSPPMDARIRVHGSGTPNIGSKVNFDDVIIQKVSESEMLVSGSDISTMGYYDVQPTVTVRGVATSTSSPSSSRTDSYVTPESEVELTKSKTNVKVYERVLPALTGGSKYKIDEFSCQIHSSNSSAYGYVFATIQAASLWGGVETTVGKWSSNQTSGYKTYTYKLPYLLQGAENEAMTIRFYIRSSNTSYYIYARNLGYKFTEALDATAVKNSSIYLYNVDDSTRIMQCCSYLPVNHMEQIKNDGTGSYRHVESFKDGSYADVAYQITGAISRNSETNTLLFPVNSSIIFVYDSLYPITGIPFLKLFSISGNPQISIADDSGTNGAPGTFYTVDGNLTALPDKSEVQRELDNKNNLRLRGYSKWYVKVEPYSGQTCEIAQYLMYAALDTQDAERFFIYATHLPNTIGVQVGGDGKCSVIATIEYRDARLIR